MLESSDDQSEEFGELGPGPLDEFSELDRFGELGPFNLTCQALA